MAGECWCASKICEVQEMSSTCQIVQGSSRPDILQSIGAGQRLHCLHRQLLVLLKDILAALEVRLLLACCSILCQQCLLLQLTGRQIGLK